MPRRKKAASKASGSVKIVGGSQDLPRVLTGLYSLDKALGGGFPLVTLTEIYGHPYNGKSTLAYHLAGVIAAQSVGPNVALMDTEGVDRDYLAKAFGNAGATGTVKIVDEVVIEGRKRTIRSAEDQLDELFEVAYDDTYSVVMLDSVGGTTTTAIREGAMGDANMGALAKLIGKFSRLILTPLRTKETPSACIVTNHLHPNLGVPGSSTSGGVTLSYMAQNRLRVQVKQRDETGLRVEGTADKARYRGKTPERYPFRYFVVPDYGVHIGLSAVLDCIAYGLATDERTVSLGSKSYGYFSKMAEKYTDWDLFQPFVDALDKHRG
jgi:RecA/RadA recombinase